MSTSRLSIALLLMTPLVAQAQEAAVPQQASSCVSCHSADGNPLVAGVPILAGQRADYLASALRAYRDGRRTGGSADVMQIFARELSDEDIEEISKWFAAH